MDEWKGEGLDTPLAHQQQQQSADRLPSLQRTSPAHLVATQPNPIQADGTAPPPPSPPFAPSPFPPPPPPAAGVRSARGYSLVGADRLPARGALMFLSPGAGAPEQKERSPANPEAVVLVVLVDASAPVYIHRGYIE